MKFKNSLHMMLIGMLSVSYVSAQDAPAAASGGPVAALERVTLEDFEQAEDWKAKSTSPLGETKTLKMIQRGLIKDVFDEKSTPDAYDVKTGQYSDAKQEERVGKNHILGVKTFFASRGFDRVEVSPPQEYIIKGKARQVSVWVLGRNYRHTLYAKFRDYKGNTHNIRLGRLDFFGWRKLTAPIPGFIPQSTRYALLDKNIKFVSLFVASDSHEPAGEFYFYVDDLEVRTDKQEAVYPGFEIKDNW
ncbi:MAG: endoflagellar filament sheath protein [Leptospiraceae bacterium]|nr:endoflagellar filament sheath protein [Leptospiraceae bacterium]MCP5511653.1 endoflagellar filament sheath protein [Leptospiraceae bacterium]